MKKLTEADKSHIRAQIVMGVNKKRIAEMHKVHLATIYRFLKSLPPTTETN